MVKDKAADIIDYIEKINKIKLFEWQKMFIRKLIEHERRST